MIRTDRYHRTSAHLSRNSQLSTGSAPKQQGYCSARFWRKTWVPLLLGAVFTSCDPSGGTQPPKPKEPKAAWHVTTFAGNSAVRAGTDGIGTAAGFGSPVRIAQIGDTLYVTDADTHNIRTVHTTTAQVGTIVTSSFLGGGYRDGAGTSAWFDYPSGVVAGTGNTLYVADWDNHRIREVRAGATAAATQVITLAGSGTAGHADGAGTAAQFHNPDGLALSGDTLYVADQNNHRIRAIDLASPNKTVSTIAGSTLGHTDGAGTTARFKFPTGLALSGDTLYVADQNNHCIRAIDLASPNKTVSTIAGSGTAGHADGAGTAAQFNFPAGLAVSGDTLYVTSGGLIRKLEYR